MLKILKNKVIIFFILLIFSLNNIFSIIDFGNKVNVIYWQGGNIDQDKLTDSNNIVVLAFIISDPTNHVTPIIHFNNDYSGPTWLREIKTKLVQKYGSAGKVYISIGGETGVFYINSSNKATFTTQLENILSTYVTDGVIDGIDIDIEGETIRSGLCDPKSFADSIYDTIQHFKSLGYQLGLSIAAEYPYLSVYGDTYGWYKDFIKQIGVRATGNLNATIADGTNYISYFWLQFYNQVAIGVQYNGANIGSYSPGYYSVFNSDSTTINKWMENFLPIVVWSFCTDAGINANPSNIKIPLNKMVMGTPATNNGAGGCNSYGVHPENTMQIWNDVKTFCGDYCGGFMSWDADWDAQYYETVSLTPASPGPLGTCAPTKNNVRVPWETSIARKNVLLGYKKVQINLNKNENITQDISLNISVESNNTIQNLVIKTGEPKYIYLQEGDFTLSAQGIANPAQGLCYTPITNLPLNTMTNSTINLNSLYSVNRDIHNVKFNITGISDQLAQTVNIIFSDSNTNPLTSYVYLTAPFMKSKDYGFKNGTVTNLSVTNIPKYDYLITPKTILDNTTNVSINYGIFKQFIAGYVNNTSNFTTIMLHPNNYYDRIVVNGAGPSGWDAVNTISFTPSDSYFSTTVNELKSKGKKIILGISQNSWQYLTIKNNADVTALTNSIKQYVNTYGFNGVDFCFLHTINEITPNFLANVISNLRSEYGSDFIIQISPYMVDSYYSVNFSDYTFYKNLLSACSSYDVYLVPHLYNGNSTYIAQTECFTDICINTSGKVDFVYLSGNKIVNIPSQNNNLPATDYLNYKGSNLYLAITNDSTQQSKFSLSRDNLTDAFNKLNSNNVVFRGLYVDSIDRDYALDFTYAIALNNIINPPLPEPSNIGSLNISINSIDGFSFLNSIPIKITKDPAATTVFDPVSENLQINSYIQLNNIPSNIRYNIYSKGLSDPVNSKNYYITDVLLDPLAMDVVTNFKITPQQVLINDINPVLLTLVGNTSITTQNVIFDDQNKNYIYPPASIVSNNMTLNFIKNLNTTIALGSIPNNYTAVVTQNNGTITSNVINSSTRDLSIKYTAIAPTPPVNNYTNLVYWSNTDKVYSSLSNSGYLPSIDNIKLSDYLASNNAFYNYIVIEPLTISPSLSSNVSFTPIENNFTSTISGLQAKDLKILFSIKSFDGNIIYMKSDADKTTFCNGLKTIVDTYRPDGFDINISELYSSNIDPILFAQSINYINNYNRTTYGKALIINFTQYFNFVVKNSFTDRLIKELNSNGIFIKYFCLSLADMNSPGAFWLTSSNFLTRDQTNYYGFNLQLDDQLLVGQNMGSSYIKYTLDQFNENPIYLKLNSILLLLPVACGPSYKDNCVLTANEINDLWPALKGSKIGSNIVGFAGNSLGWDSYDNKGIDPVTITSILPHVPFLFRNTTYNLVTNK